MDHRKFYYRRFNWLTEFFYPHALGAFPMRLATCVVFALMSATTAAQTEQQQTVDQLCALEGSWAREMMRARQTGAALSQQMELMASAPGGSREGVLAAYEHPRYSTPDMQQRAIDDFANDIELRCYQSN